MLLHLKNKIMTLHHKVDIFDEQDNVAYEAQSKMISITDKTTIKNAKGKEVAEVHRKAVTIHEKYYVDMVNGTSFELSTELLHVGKEVIDINGLDMKIKGNFLEHNYNIVDNNDNVVAICAKKWIAVHEVYTLDIKDESRVDEVVATFIVLEHILMTREQNNGYV